MLVVAMVIAAGGVFAYRHVHDGGDSGGVSLIGDSLLHEAMGDVETALPDHRLRFDAVPGSTIAMHQQDAVAANDGAATVVFVLGTNDAYQWTSRVPAQIDAILAAVSSVPCVRWVTVASLNAHARAIDALLRQQAERRANLALVDWEPLAAAHPEYQGPDGIHHTAAGRRALAAAIAAAVRGC